MTSSDPVEAALQQLEAASRRREAELCALADDVAASVSRVAVVRSMLSSAGSWRRRTRT